MNGSWIPRSIASWPMALAAGLLLGVAYTLSPLTIWSAVLLGLIWRAAGRGVSPREREWLTAVLAVAILLRVLAIAGLFLTADPSQPYANFFGDEELFKRRTVWLRNIGLGLPVAPSDIIYTFDEVGQSSYMYALAYLQALVGTAPYGVHVLNLVVYLASAVLLYRVVRPAYGGLAALGGLVILLFLPSLFSWSISALKEPLYFAACAAELACGVYIVRGRRWWQRALAVAGVVALAYVLQTLRLGGLALAAAGTLGGVTSWLLLTRARLLAATVILLPLIAAIVFSRPAVQERVMQGVHRAAFQHWGHISTSGYTYKLIEPRFYAEGRLSVRTMTPPEAVRFVSRAFVAYFTVPLPWQIESRAMLAFLPELVIWYVIIALVPFGIAAGLKRDTYVTCLIVSHALVAVAMVALTGGNVGTLVRHRGLAMPYLGWLAALGACVVMAWLIRRKTSERVTTEWMKPAWR